jgi:hypothetical protein
LKESLCLMGSKSCEKFISISKTFQSVFGRFFFFFFYLQVFSVWRKLVRIVSWDWSFISRLLKYHRSAVKWRSDE